MLRLGCSPRVKIGSSFFPAGVVELVDSVDLGSSGFAVQVRVLSPAPRTAGDNEPHTSRCGAVLASGRWARTHLNGTRRWRVPTASANTGGNQSVFESCRPHHRAVPGDNEPHTERCGAILASGRRPGTHLNGTRRCKHRRRSDVGKPGTFLKDVCSRGIWKYPSICDIMAWK